LAGPFASLRHILLGAQFATGRAGVPTQIAR
jgi:hypothetical protein